LTPKEVYAESSGDVKKSLAIASTARRSVRSREVERQKGESSAENQ